MKRLTKTQILKMNSLLIQETGGSDGIRDEGLLDSALNLPFQSLDGEDIYKTIQAKAARLGFSLINNHSFVDGNKRIGILAMLVSLEINGIEIICTDEELIELGLGVADGSVSYKDLLNWIIDHS
ncbi:MAG: type II toxin-antitoxin system death-on-curing family toxin [Tissierellia bacterium]|nr:type II toxin-antitoxin system death-on-curing family toxin [Tissierellia bacterium]